MSAPDDDLRARPWDYPGRPPAGTGLLRDGVFTPAPWSRLRVLTAGRVPVVAVGSNASPVVLHHKLAAGAVPGPVPFAPATASGIGVGHSAHVSVPGFVAAAPYAAPGARTRVWVTWLDEEQLAQVDRTEPNYARRRVSARRGALDLAGGDPPVAYNVYDSRRGVLTPPGGAPLALATQPVLHAFLYSHWDEYAVLLAGAADADTVRTTMRRLAEDADLRARVRDAWRESGWATPSGLAPLGPDGVAPSGSPASGSSPGRRHGGADGVRSS